MNESMAGMKRTHYATDLSLTNVGEKVTVMGWVQKRRNLGSVIFLDIRDRSGLIQVFLDENVLSQADFEKGEKLRAEFVVAIEGMVQKRGDANPNLKTGEIEVQATALRILNHSETPPFHIEDDVTAKEDLRLKYRYLDLRRPVLQKNLMLRHKVTTAVREFFDREGFLEIETPMLTRSTPEGARDYLVPSRINQGMFYALPQSPQIFKQLLMLSGYDRYIQIAKCFRDEDLRADRQPEFTQIDMELSFVTQEDIINLNERWLQFVFKKVMDMDIAIPFKRITYKEAMERFGSDKPDMRFGVELKDLAEVAVSCGFAVFSDAIKNGGSVRAINAKGMADLPRKQIDALTELCKYHGAKGMAYIAVKEEELKSSFAKFMKDEEMKKILELTEAEVGDLILIVADKEETVFNVLGELRLEVARRLNLIDENVFDFVWVIEFPLLEWNEEQNRFTAKHHPFTSPMEEDIPLLDTDPAKVRANAYDICLNGNEIGGGSLRIYQRDLQEKMFAALGFTKEEAYERFGFLLDAFQYGVPPHGGLAYGLDRVVMLMAKAESIRDVIAFPKVKDASDPMSDAPNVVEDKQLRELGIAIVKAEKE
ncbi:aspartate--tRNA ligase [Clostridiales bacterium COT073_COT-073]|nr:aspartate--tRNA ligase [Clostridiales bacterium COT073_COT-073]